MKELSLHILDIVENSISANSDFIKLFINEDKGNNLITFEVIDNGKGMDKEFLSTVTDPFKTTRTTRKVGLGLSLLKVTAERCDGSLNIESEIGKGTKVTASLGYDHIDRPPMGDLISTIISILTSSDKIDFLYCHKTNSGEYLLDTKEIKKILDGLTINDLRVINFLKKDIKEGLESINGGEL